MCGITGLINLDGASISPVVLKKMTEAIIHRGPDGEGQWIEGNIGLGHRRLAIIDLSPAGHQPMISADHRWVLSYNGEIYNYRELRTELEAEGVWDPGAVANHSWQHREPVSVGCVPPSCHRWWRSCPLHQW